MLPRGQLVRVVMRRKEETNPKREQDHTSEGAVNYYNSRWCYNRSASSN